MDIISAIRVLERYQGVSRLLGVPDDEAILGEIIALIAAQQTGEDGAAARGGDASCAPSGGSPSTGAPDNAAASPRKRGASSAKRGGDDFIAIIHGGDDELSACGVNPQIAENRADMAGFWQTLDENQKKAFTAFELQLILHYISPHFDTYQKSAKKDRLIADINSIVRQKRMNSAYERIKA